MPAADRKKEKKGDTPREKRTGVYLFANGDKYDGEYVLSEHGSLERHGNGTHETPGGIRYQGEWGNDKMNGQGCLSHASGSTYDGDFSNNKFHGFGKYTWPNGSFYEGRFVENKLEGEGQFTDTEGQVWTGTFRYKAAPGLQFKLMLD
ncbi:hypothetical protein LOTGIDRAFT_199227 [Lottia gigantea]|uniref:MORN repeat-containing protein 2 n=1 Tax=Lottia gigantea TaxID=225164 RepID=V4CM58_LOTGI|nr:hypothetical protein LOTGIDRAFT_199227 [Lottia gigantea]ESP03380.1 hypothetical protein LOTGIDRAFT_199227 [Lottia gigantea]